MLDRLFLVLIALLYCALPAAAQAPATRGVALVIGNGAYTHQPKLPNPKKDAVAMAATLRKLGYEVIEGVDLKLAEMQQKLVEFADRLDQNPGAGVLFFAGHGIQVKGQNYLMPVDADVAKPAEVDIKLIPLALVRKYMEGSKATARILFLDACRTNPFPERLVRAGFGGGAGGLAAERKTVGTHIAFATQPDTPAEDGREANSPFTSALLRHIETSGKSLGDMMTLVRRDVLTATEHRQMPWDEGGLTELYYFAPGAEADPSTPSLDAGRQQLSKNNFANAKWHFEALAAEGNVEAMRELFLMAETTRDFGAALGWLKKAADTGNRPARLAYAWHAGHRDDLGELSKDWESRLTVEEAERLAKTLFAEGELEAALLLQALALKKDNAQDPQPPLRVLPELRQLMDANHAAAIAMIAREHLFRLPEPDAAKPSHKAATEAVLKSFERAARLGSPVATHDLVADEKLAGLVKKLAVTPELRDDELTGLIQRAAVTVSRKSPWGETLDSMFSAANLTVYNDGELTKAAATRLMRPQTRDLQSALKFADDTIATREVIHKRARRGSLGPLNEARRLKAGILAELGRTAEAVALMADVEDAEDLTPMLQLVAKANWAPDLRQIALGAYAKNCSDMSFGTSRDAMSECEKASHQLLIDKQSAFYTPMHKAAREWLQRNDSDDAEKGRALLLIAMLTMADPAFLRSGESVQQHLTQAARLGAPEAVAALKANNWPVPDAMPAVRFKSQDLEAPQGAWRAVKISDNNVPALCRSSTTTAILTKSLKRSGPPTVAVMVDLINPGVGPSVGKVRFDTSVEGAIEPGARLFVGRDEYIAPLEIVGAAITVAGDQTPLIVRLANGAMLRLEYRAANRNVVDVFSLDGFTGAYRALLKNCAGMTSAFEIAAAAAKAAAATATAPPAAPTVAPTPTVPAKAAVPAPVPVTSAPTTAPPVVAPPASPAAKPPAPPVRPVVQPSLSLQRQVGRYFKGNGYDKRVGGSYDQCAAGCAADRRCVALEFQHANLTCQFYDKLEASFTARGTDIAVRP